MRMRFGRPFAKKRFSWVTSLFNESAVDVTAASSMSHQILDAADYDIYQHSLLSGTAGAVKKHGHVHRVVYRARVMLTPVASLAGHETWSMIWACYQIDEDDTATEPFNSTGQSSVFRSERVLQTGVVGGVIRGSAAASTQGDSFPGIPVEFDLNQKFTQRPEQILLVTYQFQSSVSILVASANISAVSRVLIESP